MPETGDSVKKIKHVDGIDDLASLALQIAKDLGIQNGKIMIDFSLIFSAAKVHLTRDTVELVEKKENEEKNS